MSYKEMIIPHPKVSRMPKLELNGKWLDALGFTVGTTVHVGYYDSCLTLSTHGKVKNNLSDLVVTSKLVRKRPRTHLVLEWWLLRKYGFHVGERVVLHLMQGTIQITKINHFSTTE
jgi:hypothetical protein